MNKTIKKLFDFMPLWSGIAILAFGYFLYTSGVSKVVDMYQEEFKQLQTSTTSKHIDTLSSPIDTKSMAEKTGPIGDTFGGTLGPLVGLIACYFTLLAFWIQYKANEQQREYIKKQRFEDTFFRLLENHQEIVSSLDLIRTPSKAPRRLSAGLYKSIYNTDERPDPIEIIASNRDCFKVMYNELIRLAPSNNADFDKLLTAYDIIQDNHKSDLHHYFRFIYRIVKFVKESDIDEDEKYKYTSILRAVFSPYELAMLFLNGRHEFGIEKFRPLLEEFSFFKNLDTKLISRFYSGALTELYHPLALPHESEERQKLLTDWKEQTKNEN